MVYHLQASVYYCHHHAYEATSISCSRRTWTPATSGSLSTIRLVALKEGWIWMAFEDYSRDEGGGLQEALRPIVARLSFSISQYGNVHNFSSHTHLNTEHEIVVWRWLKCCTNFCFYVDAQLFTPCINYASSYSTIILQIRNTAFYWLLL